MPDQVPPEVVRERYGRLVELVDDVAWRENQHLLGQRLELLVAEGEGRKDAATHRLTGRARDNRLVHFTADTSVEIAPSSVGPVGTTTPPTIRPGDIVDVEVTYAAPHHLVADGPVLAHRRTRSGDAWETRTSPRTPSSAVGLGMPTVGSPVSPVSEESTACG
jgi:tRNA-2-methylthio-N6-dimethylallyladenosine synthase